MKQILRRMSGENKKQALKNYNLSKNKQTKKKTRNYSGIFICKFNCNHVISDLPDCKHLLLLRAHVVQRCAKFSDRSSF